ncbi:MAG: cupin domain-containing protein [candidate division Zixibacteria bacterium]|nr:cupin domain-containing protein [candidate division Zixibacteria bacterium]
MPKIDLLREGRKVKDPFKPIPISRVGDANILLSMIKGEYKKHNHPYDEFFYVLDGKIELEFDKEKMVLKKGEGVLVKKGQWHKSRSKGKSLVMLFERSGMESQFSD